MEITREQKMALLNELFNTYKDSDPAKAMVVMSIINDVVQPPSSSGARPLVLM